MEPELPPAVYPGKLDAFRGFVGYCGLLSFRRWISNLLPSRSGSKSMKTALFLILFTASAYAQTGLGKSTLTCLDKDGDGYGVGPGCSGPDADDTDPAVYTAAQTISAYGSINAFLIHLGYQSASSPATVWCISATGNDSTGAGSTNADGACTNPYRDWTGVATHLIAPYIVIFRQGTYTQQIGNAPSGTSSRNNVIMSYPGEQATIDYSAAVGNAVNMAATGYVTMDGFKILSNASGAGYSGGTYIRYGTGSQTIAFVGDILRHCEISGGGTDSNVDADNVTNFTVEENVIHDPYPNGGQHNVYIGSNTVASSGVIVRRNILYNVHTGGYPNLQFNGRCTGCYFESNILYNADGQQVAFLEGVSNSFLRDNLAFNTGVASQQALSFTLYNYDSGQCQMTGVPSICAWDQTGNVIENNTFWTGTASPFGGGTLSGPGIEIVNASTMGPCGNGGTPPCGNLGGNFYRNNIVVGAGFVAHGSNSGYPPVVYVSSSQNYLALDTWTDNIINSQDGSAYILGFGPGSSYGYFPYDCASFNSMALSGTGCSTASPGFVNVNPSYYSTPALFNFSLLTGSPALAAGTTVGAPSTDIWGNSLENPPPIGAEGLPGQAAPVTSLSCTPASLASGVAATCTVTLGQEAGSGGGTVALSSNAAALAVPPSVLVAAGAASASFNATAGTASTGQTAVVTATFNGGSQTASVTLLPPAVLTSVACNPASLSAGSAATCTVTLSGAAAAAAVALSSSNVTTLTVPASVSVATGADTATFNATAGTVSNSQTALVTATWGGVSQTASLTVMPSSEAAYTGGWTDLSNTVMQTVCPPNNFGGMTYAFNANCHNVMAAWSGGAADTTRNRLIVWGGGGPDYSGNEVYSLNVGANPPAMTRLNDPSVYASSGCPDANPDGTPASRHTYNDLVYLPGPGRMFDFSGRIAPCDGPTNHTWTLDLSVSPPVWHAMDPVNGFDPTNVEPSGGGYVCAYDPNTADVICAGTIGLILRYAYSTNTYTQLNTNQSVPYASTGVIDPVRKLMVFMGPGYQSTVPLVQVLDISSGSSYIVQDWSSQVTGCGALASATYPGLAYDTALDRIVGYPNTGNTVYLFDPDTKTCVPQTFPNGPPFPPSPNQSGTFGRFQYFPSLDTFIVVGNTNQDAFSLKLTSGTGATHSACDLNDDGVVNLFDVQIAINQVLGISPCTNADLLQNGQCSVVDVQRVLNASLGGACLIGP